MSVILTSKDISKKLKIGKSLVREISKQLEKEAYQFTKNQNTRMYSIKDFRLIQTILENYHNHQNLPLAVQNALENQIQNAELTYEEGLSTQQSIDGAVHIEAVTNNVDLSGQIEESTYINEVISKTEVSINNNEPANSIDHSLHIIKVEADHIDDQIVDIKDQIEESSSIHNITVQNEVHSNHFESTDQTDLPSIHDELVADLETTKTSQEVSQHIVSISSSNEEVSHQMPSNNLVKHEELHLEQLQDSMEQLDVTSAYDTNLNETETINHSFHTALNKTDLEHIDMQTEEHKLVELHAATDSNQIMFEEFMSQISNLANQNELILQQNQTLIQQNLLKDQKLEKILHSVEEKSEELQELASVIEEKDEKLEQMFEEIQVREVSRDAQLMRMIREMQETKKMVAASKEKDWKSSLKSFFIKPKAIK